MRHFKKHLFIPKPFKDFLKKIFPCFILLFLLYFQNPVLNPGGILAIIPIYFYTLYYPSLLPLPISLIGVFLIDYYYNMDSIWLIFFLIIYLFLSFQKWIDLKKQNFYSITFFSIIVITLFSLSAISMSLRYGSHFFLFRTFWTVILLIVLYTPMAKIFNRLAEDI